MSIRLDMQATAARAADALHNRAAAITEFLLSRRMPDGGFRGRTALDNHRASESNIFPHMQRPAGASSAAKDRGETMGAIRTAQSDPWYTVFALQALAALDHPVPHAQIAAWLEQLPTLPPSAPLVDLAARIRCRAYANLPPVSQFPDHLARFRTPDGGFALQPDTPQPSAYAAFLALGAYQDLDLPCPQPLRLAASLAALLTPDGAFANFPHMPLPAVPATAAALTVLAQLQCPIPPDAVQWLARRQHPDGGFLALPGAPVPDLLSTATALFALQQCSAPLAPLRDSALAYLDTLYSPAGGWFAHRVDNANLASLSHNFSIPQRPAGAAAAANDRGETMSAIRNLDAEYTFYGLLAHGAIA